MPRWDGEVHFAITANSDRTRRLMQWMMNQLLELRLNSVDLAVRSPAIGY